MAFHSARAQIAAIGIVAGTSHAPVKPAACRGCQGLPGVFHDVCRSDDPLPDCL